MWGIDPGFAQALCDTDEHFRTSHNYFRGILRAKSPKSPKEKRPPTSGLFWVDISLSMSPRCPRSPPWLAFVNDVRTLSDAKNENFLKMLADVEAILNRVSSSETKRVA